METGLIRDLPSHCREALAEQTMKQTGLLEGDAMGGCRPDEEVAQLARIILVYKMRQAQTQLEPGALHLHQGGVDAIQARAGRQAYNPARVHMVMTYVLPWMKQSAILIH